MDEKPEQIIGHIAAQRDQLGRNLDELETRVRAGTNWRTYYEKNPMVAVGAALGGGLLLGTILSSARTSSHRSPAATRPSSLAPYKAVEPSSRASSLVSSPVTALQRREISETFDHIKAAMIAFGIAKAKEFLNEVVPGLEPHLTHAEQRGRQHASGSPQYWQASGAPQEQRPGSSHSWESAGATQQGPVPAM